MRRLEWVGRCGMAEAGDCNPVMTTATRTATPGRLPDHKIWESALVIDGGPPGTRTLNLRIKSVKDHVSFYDVY
jgi:hypothetical protein